MVSNLIHWFSTPVLGVLNKGDMQNVQSRESLGLELRTSDLINHNVGNKMLSNASNLILHSMKKNKNKKITVNHYDPEICVYINFLCVYMISLCSRFKVLYYLSHTQSYRV